MRREISSSEKVQRHRAYKSLQNFFFFGGESLQDGDCKTGHLMANVRGINHKTVSNSGFPVLDSGFFVSGTWISGLYR